MPSVLDMDGDIDPSLLQQRTFWLMNSLPVGVAELDVQRRFLEVNPALCTLLGRSRSWLLQHKVDDVIDPSDSRADSLQRQAAFEGRSRGTVGEQRLVRSDGRAVWVLHVTGRVSDPLRQTPTLVSLYLDVDRAHRDRSRLRYLAFHDALTGLPNRRSVLDRLTAALRHPPRASRPLGVLYCDVDGLKPVNDRLGHAVGDQVLIEVGRRLHGVVRREDLVGRIGGDEFVIALGGVADGQELVRVAQTAWRAAAHTVHLEGVQFDVRISVGAALAVAGDDADALLARADAALLQCKEQGGNRVELVVDVTGSQPD